MTKIPKPKIKSEETKSPKNDISMKTVPADISKLSGPDFIRFLFTSTPKTDIASDSENKSNTQAKTSAEAEEKDNDVRKTDESSNEVTDKSKDGVESNISDKQ